MWVEDGGRGGGSSFHQGGANERTWVEESKKQPQPTMKKTPKMPPQKQSDETEKGGDTIDRGTGRGSTKRVGREIFSNDKFRWCVLHKATRKEKPQKNSTKKCRKG